MELRNVFDVEGGLDYVRRLYETSFPKVERKPFEFMVKKQKEGCFEILVIVDEEGSPCGLAIMMLYQKLALLDYFAIDSHYRGRGIGSSVLKALQERYKEDKFILEIESTVGLEAGVGVDNAEERLRRKAFYLRNGMTSAGFLVNLLGVEMEVLTFGRELAFEEYFSVYENIVSKDILDKIRLVRYL